MSDYPLAPQGIFATLQGEGVMLGTPQVFVRFAGCPVNCVGCDTDYSFSRRVSLADLTRQVVSVAGAHVRWVWLTGGEPTIHDLTPLVEQLHSCGLRVALATAGINPVRSGALYDGFDFVSVSPHRIDPSWVVRRGDQLNVVPGLNGLCLSDLDGVDVSGFSHRFVTPFWYAPGDRMESVVECAAWVASRPDWRLGVQAHKAWGLS